MRAIAITGAVMSMALMTGCTNGVERLAGNASPVGAGTTASAAAPVRPVPAGTPSRSVAPVSASASTTTSRPATTTPATSEPVRTTSGPRVLGPSGLGALQLGMTRRQAEATGLIEGWEVADYLAKCGISQVKGTDAEVFTDPDRGVSYITLYGTVRTPEGIRLGSSLGAVRAAYPDWDFALGDSDSGSGGVPAPGNSRARYGIDITDGKVSHLALASDDQRCID